MPPCDHNQALAQVPLGTPEFMSRRPSTHLSPNADTRDAI
jgi:hypothetical protein